MYLRRGITSVQAAEIEQTLQGDGVEIAQTSIDLPDGSYVGGLIGAKDAAGLGDILKVGKSYHFLSQEEETDCGDAIQRALQLEIDDRSELASRLRERADRAKATLVTHNILLVAKVASETRFRGRVEHDDLIQFGLLGLMRAAEKFDPAWGTRFSTYAVWWIRQSISRGIHDNSTAVRVPVHMRERISRFRRARRQLGLGDRSDGICISRVADKLGWTEEYTAKIAFFAEQREVSIDRPLDADEGLTLGDLLSDEAPTPEEAIVSKDIEQRVRALLDGIGDERLIDIIKRRFGFGGPAETLQEIGDDYGVTRERIRQLEENGLRILRSRARKAKLDK